MSTSRCPLWMWVRCGCVRDPRKWHPPKQRVSWPPHEHAHVHAHAHAHAHDMHMHMCMHMQLVGVCVLIGVSERRRPPEALYDFVSWVAEAAAWVVACHDCLSQWLFVTSLFRWKFIFRATPTCVCGSLVGRLLVLDRYSRRAAFRGRADSNKLSLLQVYRVRVFVFRPCYFSRRAHRRRCLRPGALPQTPRLAAGLFFFPPSPPPKKSPPKRRDAPRLP